MWREAHSPLTHTQNDLITHISRPHHRETAQHAEFTREKKQKLQTRTRSANSSESSFFSFTISAKSASSASILRHFRSLSPRIHFILEKKNSDASLILVDIHYYCSSALWRSRSAHNVLNLFNSAFATYAIEIFGLLRPLPPLHLFSIVVLWSNDSYHTTFHHRNRKRKSTKKWFYSRFCCSIQFNFGISKSLLRHDWYRNLWLAASSTNWMRE